MSAVVSDIGFTAVPRGAVHFGQHHSVVPHQRERDSTNGWAAWPGRSPSPSTSSLSLNININHHHHHQYGCLYAKSHSIHSLSLPLPLYPFFLCLPRCLFLCSYLAPPLRCSRCRFNRATWRQTTSEACRRRWRTYGTECRCVRDSKGWREGAEK